MTPSQDQADWSSLRLLERFRAGDDRAAGAILARYGARLTALARSRLGARLARRVDPEDVVQSACRSFFGGVRGGQYTLARVGDLWRLLAGITKHKLLHQVRYQTAARRSVAAEVPLDGVHSRHLVARPPGVSDRADDLAGLAGRLDPFARRVLELRLRGGSIAAIGVETGRAERTVRRALERVRNLLIDSTELAPTSPGPAPTHLVWTDRDFLLRRMIGAGGMGKVYAAALRGRTEPVAIKFLRKPLLADPAIVGRFLAEAETVARLRHPRIVGTSGLGRTAGGSYFIVMDLVRGPNLAQIRTPDPVALAEVVRWVRDACEAIEYAHARGVVHCDLKPGNLLLDESRRVRVTDFGLARLLGGGIPAAAAIEGTAPFMAPEQASSTWGPVDPRTDVYGLGAVLFTLLTGRPPCVGVGVPAILAQVRDAAPVISPASLRPDLPDSLVDLCRRCLAKDPARRFASVRKVLDQLEAVNRAIL